MTLSIPVTGVPSNFRVPGGYAEIVFAQGAATSSGGVREVVLVMPKTSSGTWAVNTLNRIRAEADTVDGAGPGSMMHRAARMFLKSNKTARLWGVTYNATSGGAPVAATGSITITGTASAAGTVDATVCGIICQAAFIANDNPTTIGGRLADSINANQFLPVTASNAAGVVTLTAKIAGKSQGDGTTGVIRFRALSSHSSVTVATSGAALGLGTGTPGADGTTTEAANQLAALNILASVRKYYIGCSIWLATEVGQLKSHIALKSDPRPGLRSVGIVGYTGTLASGQTLATGRNYERLQIAWQPNSEHDTAELVGQMLAIRQKREETDAAYNFDGYGNSMGDWNLLPAFATADWPSSDDQNEAINDGLTPIASNDAGAYLVMSVTTRSKNSTGSIDDPRTLDTAVVSVPDLFADQTLQDFALTYQGYKLKDDEKLADGSVNVNQRIPPKTVTPFSFRPRIVRRLLTFEENALLQDSAGSISGLKVVIDPNNSSRLQVGCDLHTISMLHQATFRFAEVSTG